MSANDAVVVLPVLSATECEHIVRESLRSPTTACNDNDSHLNIKVIDFSLRNVGEEILGFLGGYLSLTVCVQTNKDEPPKELKFFIKSLPFDNENKRKVVQELGAFKKEVGILGDLLRCIGGTEGKTQWRPKSLYLREDLIVFEDLSKRNYETLPGRIQYEPQHVRICLDSIARMHADSLAFEIRKLDGKSIYDIYGSILFATVTPENTWFMAGLAAVKYVASHHPRFIRFAGKLTHYSELIKTIYHRLFEFKSFRSALCHMDLWKNNIMLKFERTDEGQSDFTRPLHAVLVDFQLMRYCPPGLDVMIFLHTTTNRKSREEHLESFLLHYYNVFSETLELHGLAAEDVISWNEFRSSCDYFKLCGAAFATVYLPCTYLPDKYFYELDKIDKSIQYRLMNIDRNEFILDFVSKDQVLADVVLESYEEYLELLLLETKCKC